ncbi:MULTISPECIES: DUF4440 domain-containing protein [unclassified Burkholderia]|uniref:DUF4440 domain-containing protein n=1 Tax=unclassified Burkholderia TaxID=2613784 RepID=UPI000F580267|nr:MULTISPECIES: DUF4440 domain-containing protein [unclassified Burkholderia]RQR46797.1 nuclear transport factor 2 family protein [Burkholderia sp. Bp9131]RQR79683.1 nuclear transport factor 2 family protein [Burkholderia sp. Bp9015]RQS01893.1 nuclear transport factor 2 family protein [Burkholderia sp. Bp8994]RQS34855.1 nuclear transport factor 2 family protein [Burkholderia sp. Bp8995]RQS45180.1 nuclear transport factor 2 family protein [Burkholderia sp. Bp8990]
MEPRFTLMQMREVWIDAYRHADVEQLDFVASPHFFIQHENRFRPKAQFLARMRALSAERATVTRRVAYRDDAIQIAEHAQWATISGTGFVWHDGTMDSRFDFLELWCVSDTRWRIAALCHEHT